MREYKHFNNEHPNGPRTRVIVPRTGETPSSESPIFPLQQSLQGKDQASGAVKKPRMRRRVTDDLASPASFDARRGILDLPTNQNGDEVSPHEYTAQAVLAVVDRELEALLAKSPEEQQACRERGRLWQKTRLRNGISWQEIQQKTYFSRTAVIMLEVGLLPEVPEYEQYAINSMNWVLGLTSQTANSSELNSQQ